MQQLYIYTTRKFVINYSRIFRRRDIRRKLWCPNRRKIQWYFNLLLKFMPDLRQNVKSFRHKLHRLLPAELPVNVALSYFRQLLIDVLTAGKLTDGYSVRNFDGNGPISTRTGSFFSFPSFSLG